jgi:hypothetical protein
MRDRVARWSVTLVRFLALLIVLALGAVGCAPVPPSPANAPSASPPRVTVDPEAQEVGVVALGEDAVGEVLVRNEGGAPLTLGVPNLPRGTRVDALVPELKPGGSVRLRFVVDTFAAEGSRDQAWTLVTNDPDRPRVVVRLNVDVRPFLVARPGYVRYITVQHAREGTISQTIAATDGADFRVTRVESPTPLRIEFREAMPAERDPAWTGSQWRVMTTLAADSAVGPIIGPIMVYTDHPRQKRLLIPLSGFVRPMLAVTPPEARVGDLPRTRTEALVYFVKNFAEEPIEMTGASTDVAAVRAEIEPIERGRSWHLKLFVVPGSPVGSFEGKVMLRTSSSKIPELEVPLSGRVVE